MLSRTIGVWVRNAALVLIIGAFVLFFGPQGREGGVSSVGSVNGESLNAATFEFLRDQYRDEEQRLRDQGMKAQIVRDLIDRNVREKMVRLTLMAQAARDQGFVVSDAEIGQQICSDFADPSGRCDPALIKARLDQVGFSDERPYVEFMRQRLLVARLSDFLAQSVDISKAATRVRMEREQTTLKLRYVRVPIEGAVDAAQVPASEVDEFAKREGARISAEYEKRRSEFQKPEEVRARHMLFIGSDAQEKAQTALDRLNKGEDFAKLASELSQDSATAGSGGDLGFFPRNRMEAEFENAAFAAAPQTVVGPVQTKRGSHLIRVEERRAAVDRSLEAATPELAREFLARERASGAARARAEQLNAELGQGKPLAELAQAQALDVKETPAFAASATRVPDLPPLPGLQGAALSLTLEHRSADQVFAGDDALYVIELSELDAPKPEDLEASLEGARQVLAQRAQGELLEEIYRRKRTQADAKGTIKLPALYADGA